VRPFAVAEESATPTFQLDVASNHEMASELHKLRGTEGALRPLTHKIREWRRLGTLVVFAAHSEGGRERLASILRHYGFRTRFHEGALRPVDVEALRYDIEDVHIVLGGSGRGYEIEALHIAAVDEDEIFGRKERRSERRSSRTTVPSQVLSSLRDLNEGDYVVHADHGIGRYVGLQRLEAGDVEQDFLLLIYRDDQRVYVPVTNLERVQRYVGAGDGAPSLDKLGGERWANAKRRARKSAAEVAQELVRLYAEREAREGFAFSPPDEVYREWEATFPYTETPDQQRAIEETLADMMRSRPMDRLVCGDVGYGKTEVAMRAAMKAALDGKQVAVLVPTTVLAEQHRLTFTERFEGYPITVDALSRMRSPQEQKDVIERLKAGTVDVVISTHRLLSKDVVFHDLGLLVIDEEHRFGVKHKERIKQLRAQVDSLVLTATPIPRTLQLAMLGLRDMSLIGTPPENRLAVRTVVGRGSDDVIRAGIERELSRGGQVFFVHNRIEDLEDVADRIRALVPDARVVTAHGQMDESQLEEAMLRFMAGSYNVLCSTTIIESGLDIANANTMFVDRADAMGLAQLYQLRGRVGRSSVRAYAHLLVPEPVQMTADGARRVAVLERFSELGSGFHIASHDLEIRGAGNILGPEQSGHIAEIGYDLYVTLLAEAVRAIRGEEITDLPDPEIKLAVTALLPERYIPDAGQRLGAYKRLASVHSEQELDTVVGALVDRFGRLPKEAQALVETIDVRLLAMQIGLVKVELGPEAMVCQLSRRGRLKAEHVLDLTTRLSARWTLASDLRLVRKLRGAELDSPVAAVRGALQEMAACANNPASWAAVGETSVSFSDLPSAVEAALRPAKPATQPRTTRRFIR